MTTAPMDILASCRASDSRESSHELQCRCLSAADEIERLRGEVAALASKQAEAQAKSEPAALTDAQIEAGAISLGRMWKWEMLEESYRVHYRTRFRDAITAAIAATQEQKP